LIRGLVQGVGFRPFISRLASSGNLKGEVENRNDGVAIRLATDLSTAILLREEIISKAPAAAVIKSVEINEKQVEEFSSFTIIKSSDRSTHITGVCPDIATCSECLYDMNHEARRLDYPFTNCTNCGPRFTIISALPYDRPNTSMRSFEMCHGCNEEYNDSYDRRFHAQPVACNSCGPSYIYKGMGVVLNHLPEILKRINYEIIAGNTLAVKGLGGYFLMCDALNEDAVKGLRERKQRDAKPFAVMFRDLDTLREYCHYSLKEEEALMSWRRSVVILNEKKELAPSVSCGMGTTGAILPYMPLHYLIFREINTPAIVFTSGNISDDPIIISDAEAELSFPKIASGIVACNREIVNRADDSVVALSGSKIQIIRRSRGYVPEPVDLGFQADGVFAAGAELKNTFCLGKGDQAIMSQHIGDLKNGNVFNFYNEAVSRFSSLFRFRPSVVACDLHPDYLSTRFAENLSESQGLGLVRVQHHHAHIASCMAENGLDEMVTGICFDGTGYGDDGNIWGSEFLIAGYKSYERFASFDYVPLPGGDKAVSEPWRSAWSYCRKYMDSDFDFSRFISRDYVPQKTLYIIDEMIAHGINSPLCCSAGRLFDAVSALVGLCVTEQFDSEAPMRLESVISPGIIDQYPVDTGLKISFGPAIRSIIHDLLEQTPVGIISARFHNTIAGVVSHYASIIRSSKGINKVVLTGGVFQNRYLLKRCIVLLRDNDFEVFTNNKVPANDGGISLGQLAVASKKSKKCV